MLRFEHSPCFERCHGRPTIFIITTLAKGIIAHSPHLTFTIQCNEVISSRGHLHNSFELIYLDRLWIQITSCLCLLHDILAWLPLQA